MLSIFRIFQTGFLLAAIFNLSSVACTTVPQSTNQNSNHTKISEESSDYPTEIIDVHVHPHFTGEREETSKIPITREQFIKEMKEARVIGGVALEGRDGKGYDSDLNSLNIIRCAGVAKSVDVARIEKGLKSGYYKCLKIYLGYVHQYAYDKQYEPAYQLAEKYSVPVIFHTGDTYSTVAKLKYADPLTIDEVAVDHPKINFVIAHCGNPWIQSAAEVAYKNPNVFLDGSAFLIGDLTKKSPESIQKSMIEPLSWIFSFIEDESKLMFATDWPLVNIKSYVQAFKQAIPKKHWQAVFHDNAVRVFKLDKSKKP